MDNLPEVDHVSAGLKLLLGSMLAVGLTLLFNRFIASRLFPSVASGPQTAVPAFASGAAYQPANTPVYNDPAAPPHPLYAHDVFAMQCEGSGCDGSAGNLGLAIQ